MPGSGSAGRAWSCYLKISFSLAFEARGPAERGQRSRVTRAAAAAEQDRSPGPAGPPQRAPRHGFGERSPPGPPLQTRAQEERLALWSAVHLPRPPPKRLALRVNPEEEEEAILIKS